MIGENISTSGIDLVALPVGTRLKVGNEVILEITQVRKALDDPTAVYYFEDGEKKQLDVVFASVESGGKVSEGDELEVIERHKSGPETGRVTSVNISEKTGVAKENINKSRVIRNHGFEGDAHAGSWHRQVSLLADESIAKMKDKGLEVIPGAFGENITTSGIELNTLPVGQKLRVGEKVILEVTQIGKECTTPCAIYYQVGDCIMPREGIFAAVLEDGEIVTGDEIVLID
ncbi:MAG: MOSC domain-containing protein [Actinobacteria bacterium]|nr:MOSC domain-containing protein [Actinomycetota bacterium]